MKLYHFTQPGAVLHIASDGLRPNVRDSHAHMTGGIPVVWLTRQPNNVMTAADFKDVTLRTKAVGKAMDPNWRIGGPIFGGAARVAVDLAHHDKRLTCYPTFLHKHGLQVAFDFMPPSIDVDAWFIYRGPIAAHKVQTILPRDQMLVLLDWHIGSHPDSEAVEVFTAAREHVATSPADFWDWERGEDGDVRLISF